MGIVGDLAGLPSHPFESHGGSRAVLSQMLDGISPDRLYQLVVHALPGLIDGIGPHEIAQPDLMQEGAAAASFMILRPDRRTRRTLSALLTPRRPDCPKGASFAPTAAAVSHVMFEIPPWPRPAPWHTVRRIS